MNENDLYFVQKYYEARTAGKIMFFGLFAYLAFVLAVQYFQWEVFFFVPFPKAKKLAAVFIIMTIFSYPLMKYIEMRAVKGSIDSYHMAKRLFASTMINLGIAELAALYGLVIFVITANEMYFHLFFSCSLLGVILAMPRAPRWQSYLERDLMSMTTRKKEKYKSENKGFEYLFSIIGILFFMQSFVFFSAGFDQSVDVFRKIGFGYGGLYALNGLAFFYSSYAPYRSTKMCFSFSAMSVLVAVVTLGIRFTTVGVYGEWAFYSVSFTLFIIMFFVLLKKSVTSGQIGQIKAFIVSGVMLGLLVFLAFFAAHFSNKYGDTAEFKEIKTKAVNKGDSLPFGYTVNIPENYIPVDLSESKKNGYGILFKDKSGEAGILFSSASYFDLISPVGEVFGIKDRMKLVERFYNEEYGLIFLLLRNLSAGKSSLSGVDVFKIGDNSFVNEKRKSASGYISIIRFFGANIHGSLKCYGDTEKIFEECLNVALSIKDDKKRDADFFYKTGISDEKKKDFLKAARNFAYAAFLDDENKTYHLKFSECLLKGGFKGYAEAYIMKKMMSDHDHDEEHHHNKEEEHEEHKEHKD